MSSKRFRFIRELAKMMIGSSQQQLARALLILKNNVRSFVHSSNVCVVFWLFGYICGARSISPNQSLIVNIGTYHVCGKNEPLNTHTYIICSLSHGQRIFRKTWLFFSWAAFTSLSTFYPIFYLLISFFGFFS